MDIAIGAADLDDPAHGAAIVEVLDSYAADPIGGGVPLDADVRRRLVPTLRAHPTALVLIAWAGQRPVGIAVCFFGISTFQARPLLNIHDLAVVPDRRGEGIGTALLAAAEARALEHGCCKLTLEVQDANRRARAVYERFGFADAVVADSVTRFLAKPLPASRNPRGDEVDAGAVRHGYDRWAAIYDHDGNPLVGLEEPHVRAAAGAVRGLAVLDLGCGTGRHTGWLAAQGASVTAVDFSPGMLAEARRKPEVAGVRFIEHDLHAPLPLPDGSFDLVVSGLVLEHLSALDGFFGEIHRVLRPAGRAVVSAMHPAMFLRNRQARFTDPATGETVQPGSVAHQIGDFVNAAVRAGLRLDALVERAPDAAFAARHPRARKHIGWPMLIVLEMSRAT